MSEHFLKTWAAYFDAVASGEKTFEVRRDDRGFQKGDVLILRKWNEKEHRYETPIGKRFSYVEIRKRITWILTGGQFGIEPGYIVMGLADEGAPQ